MSDKVLQYENFINDVLRKDLQRVLEQRDGVYEKIAQYLQLKNTIQILQESGDNELKTEVDLGCHFYVQAHVEDSSTVCVAVGYGFFVEMSHAEALRFIEKKTKQLNVVCGSCRVWLMAQKMAELRPVCLFKSCLSL
ncbi:hypothetical protein NHX12_034177 [Muraenolepis orangiensis]|uniref:Protein UXT n=1 Tax=Muraenolepis orangiensis TaxID=630683 RepID=A0A9Q0D7C0_9TELE|nr:hypothetical protein NHX12_034177 [Muraenolepis orangiensis]